ncbi:MAG: hypothetical protein ACYTG2_10620 [Planctomycetota bacterium]
MTALVHGEVLGVAARSRLHGFAMSPTCRQLNRVIAEVKTG